MNELFIAILNMSLAASWAVLIVLILRLLLRHAPKRFSYILWAAPFLRLLVPFTITSAIALIPASVETIPQDIALSVTPRIYSGITAIDELVNPALQNVAPEVGESANPLAVMLAVGEAVWLLGIAVLLVYSAVTLFLLRRDLRVSAPLLDNVYIADRIKSPFVIGLFRPKIYLPSNLTEREREYVLLHERVHIKRGDHIIKLLAFAALCIHWFNPFVWLAFFCLVRDMESSCDERVLASAKGDIRAEYSASILSLSTGHRIISGTPLAFGEGDAKERIKNVMKYKKPLIWVTAICFVVVAVVSVSLLCSKPEKSIAIIGGADGPTAVFISDNVKEETFTLPDTAPEALIFPIDTSEASIVRGFANFHTGIDIAEPVGTPIYAAADGIVVKAVREGEATEEMAGYGSYVIINHGGGMTTLYAHNSKNLVTVGDTVKSGDAIAEVGITGNSTGAHVHFGVLIDGVQVDPARYLKDTEGWEKRIGE